MAMWLSRTVIVVIIYVDDRFAIAAIISPVNNLSLLVTFFS